MGFMVFCDSEIRKEEEKQWRLENGRMRPDFLRLKPRLLHRGAESSFSPCPSHLTHPPIHCSLLIPLARGHIPSQAAEMGSAVAGSDPATHH